jgi:hypothetical protein
VYVKAILNFKLQFSNFSWVNSLGFGSNLFLSPVFLPDVVFLKRGKFSVFFLKFVQRLKLGCKLLSALLGFSYYRIILYSGLGFKKKLNKTRGVLMLYTGNRDWVFIPVSSWVKFFPIKRRNFGVVSSSKGLVDSELRFFRTLQKTALYKLKGFLDARVRGKFLFVRRIKIASIKTKLSKKQKLL